MTPYLTALFVLTFGISCFAASHPPLRLMLDPGHTAATPGALGCSGTFEKIHNDRLTESIAATVTTERTSTVRITRTPDAELGLLDRVKNSGSADIFLSVHHDSVQPRDGKTVVDGGRKGFCSSAASGFSIYLSRNNPAYDSSLVFAEILGRKLIAAGMQPNLYHARKIPGENHPLLDPQLGIYAQDNLVVLKHAKAPAVLLEAGVIANPEDEARVSSPEARTLIARAVSDALREFKLREEKKGKRPA